jgi:hypothetical protein
MPPRKPFLLRLPPDLLDELNRWAADELRSLNAQIEYVLREAVRQRRRKRIEPAEGTKSAPASRGG